MLLPVSSATHRSTTAACLFCGMKSCTGSTSSTGCATSWQYWAYHSLHGTAPQYLTSLLTSSSEVTGRQYLRSAAQQKLIVPRCRRKTFGCRAFSVASPSVWNALPDSLRDPELTLDIFRRHLKTYFFTLY